MILNLYLIRKYLTYFAIVSLGIVIMMLLIDFLEHIRRFSGNSPSTGELMRLTILNLFGSFYQLLPLVALLASIWTFIALSRSSEMTIARASGRSAIRTLIPIIGSVFLLGTIAVAILNPIVAATQKEYELSVSRINGADVGAIAISDGEIWLRQGDQGTQSVISAERSNLDGTQLFNVTFFKFSDSGELLSRVHSQQATLVQNKWQLAKYKTWTFPTDPQSQMNLSQGVVGEIETTLTAQHISNSFGVPSSISIWNLPQFIQGLNDSGFSARRHLVWFHLELALPAFLAAITVLAASLNLDHWRLQRTGVMVLTTVIMGFGLYFLRSFGQVLAENGQISAILGAWVPPAFAFLLALGYLLHKEEG